MGKGKIVFPREGIDHHHILEEIQANKQKDVSWNKGKVFGYVYHPGEEYESIVKAVHEAYFYENGLSPSLFPSIIQMENEIVGMTSNLLHGDEEVSGSVTSGGTESIILTVKSARKKFREEKPEIKKPQIIIPETGHPAFIKAAELLDVEIKIVPVGEDKRVQPDEISNAISSETIMIVASAPNFPYGVVDPIEEIGAIAIANKVLLHVDACLGGFMLPFLEDLGYKVPPFDFKVPGVTSISTDLHKFAYTPKGASIILYRSDELRKKQFFVYTDWPGGIYASPTLSGSKGAGTIASAWALLKLLGFDGYRAIAQQVMETSREIQSGIEANSDLEIVASPDMSTLAFASKTGKSLLIGDEMSQRGWHLDRLQFPNALHINVTKLNVGMSDEFIHDLNESVEAAKKINLKNLSSDITVAGLKGISKVVPSYMFRKIISSNASKSMDHSQMAVMYGITGSLENRKDLHELVTELLGKMYGG